MRGRTEVVVQTLKRLPLAVTAILILTLALPGPSLSSGERAAPEPTTSRIAFERSTDRGSDIYVMNADGSGVRRLTRPRARSRLAAGPVWSPDGGRIAFVRFSDGDPPLGIYVINADGSGERRLTAGRSLDSDHAWSPDGKKIVFVRGSPRGSVSNIYVMNADGSGVRRLTSNGPDDRSSDQNPEWSPDGQKIIFARHHFATGDSLSVGHIYIMNADGSGLRRMTDLPSRSEHPKWSPDGSKIAFVNTFYGDSNDREGSHGAAAGIYVMSADGSGLTRLTKPVGADYSLVWSPDSRRIAFARSVSWKTDVYTMNADGSGVAQLTKSGEYQTQGTPSWSPDGQLIAFEGSEFGYPSDIYVMNVDGSDVRQLTRHPGREMKPVWSPARP